MKSAGPLFDRLAPWADQLSNSGTTAEGPISHYLGGLAHRAGSYDEADAYFAQAAVLNDRVGAKFWAARTDLQWGRMLAKRRSPELYREGSGPSHQGADRRSGQRVRER